MAQLVASVSGVVGSNLARGKIFTASIGSDVLFIILKLSLFKVEAFTSS